MEDQGVRALRDLTAVAAEMDGTAGTEAMAVLAETPTPMETVGRVAMGAAGVIQTRAVTAARGVTGPQAGIVGLVETEVPAEMTVARAEMGELVATEAELPTAEQGAMEELAEPTVTVEMAVMAARAMGQVLEVAMAAKAAPEVMEVRRHTQTARTVAKAVTEEKATTPMETEARVVTVDKAERADLLHRAFPVIQMAARGAVEASVGMAETEVPLLEKGVTEELEAAVGRVAMERHPE